MGVCCFALLFMQVSYINAMVAMRKGHFEEGVKRALYQVACKAAIKGGRVYNSAVITWLVEKVLMIPDITVCPHGRPIAYKLTKNQLDRQFDRLK